MDEAAVLDVPVTGTEETTVETPVETSVPEQATTETPGQPDKPTFTPAFQDGKLSPSIKAHLDQLKTTAPEVEKQLRHALLSAAQLSKELPGGIKELNQMRALVEERGGPEGLQEQAQTLAGFQEFDRMYAAGDPKALDFMTSDPEGQRAFLQLVPMALEKYQNLHPDGYNSHMAGVFVSTMDQARIPLLIERLADFVGDNPKAMEQLQRLDGFYRGMLGLAQKKVELPKGPEADPRAAENDQREANLTRQQWGLESSRSQQAAFDSEWGKLAGGRTISDLQRDAINELFLSKFSKAIQGKHEQTLERYRAAGDKNGFMRYAAELNRTEVPRILKACFDSVVPAKPGPKTPPQLKPPLSPPNQALPKGFTQVGSMPATSDIDLRLTTSDMARNHQAILKDGRRVMWKR